MDFSNINYLAIITAAVAGTISGAAWYGAFAKSWMKAVGFTEEPKPDSKINVVTFLMLIRKTEFWRHFSFGLAFVWRRWR